MNGPRPIIDDTATIVTSIGHIHVDGNRATAGVSYRMRNHVLRDPNPPGQLGSADNNGNGSIGVIRSNTVSSAGRYLRSHGTILSPHFSL